MRDKNKIKEEMDNLRKDYVIKKEELTKELKRAELVESERLNHSMKHKEDFYIEIFEHLLTMEKKYCKISKNEFRCDHCPFSLKNKVCVKNWLLSEFDVFTEEAQKELK